MAAKKGGIDTFLDDFGDMKRADFSKSLPSPSSTAGTKGGNVAVATGSSKSSATDKSGNWGVQIKPGGAVRVIKKSSTTSRVVEGGVGRGGGKPAKFTF